MTKTLAFLAMLCAVPAMAEERTITVSGTGTVSAQPDVAIVVAGVVSQAADPALALTANNAKMTKLFAALKELKVPMTCVQTSNFRLNAVEERNPRTGQTEFTGYAVSNMVTVRVHNLDILGKVLGSVVENGANRINSVNFQIENQAELKDKALKAAMLDAQKEAEVALGALNNTVGAVLSVSVSTGRNYPVYGRMEMAASMDVPVAGGTENVTVQVSVKFRIIPKILPHPLEPPGERLRGVPPGTLENEKLDSNFKPNADTTRIPPRPKVWKNPTPRRDRIGAEIFKDK